MRTIKHILLKEQILKNWKAMQAVDNSKNSYLEWKKHRDVRPSRGTTSIMTRHVASNTSTPLWVQQWMIRRHLWPIWSLPGKKHTRARAHTQWKTCDDFWSSVGKFYFVTNPNHFNFSIKNIWWWVIWNCWRVSKWASIQNRRHKKEQEIHKTHLCRWLDKPMQHRKEY